jgi:hypothetical protein
MRRQTFYNPPAASWNVSAKRSNVRAAGRPQDENHLAGPHLPQHQRGRGCGAGGCCIRRSAANRRRRGIAARRRRSATGRVDRFLTVCREVRLVLFQTIQRRGASGRDAGAVLLIIIAARASYRSHLRTAWLFGLGACRRLGSRRRIGGRCRSRGLGGRGGLGGRNWRRLRFGRGRGCLGFGRGRGFDGTHRCLAARREARHVLLQAPQRRLAAGRDAGAMGLVIRAALGSDGAALCIGRSLRMGRGGRDERDDHHRRPERRRASQRVEHLNKSLLSTPELPSHRSKSEKLDRKISRVGSFSFSSSTASGLLLSCKSQRAFSRTK